MGMGNIKVFGIRPADHEYSLKLQAYYALEKANIGIPRELEQFFNYYPPNILGEEIDLAIDSPPCLTVLKEDGAYGYTIELAKLSKSIKFIKVKITY